MKKKKQLHIARNKLKPKSGASFQLLSSRLRNGGKESMMNRYALMRNETHGSELYRVPYWTIEGLSNWIGLSPYTVYRWVRLGLIFSPPRIGFDKETALRVAQIIKAHYLKHKRLQTKHTDTIKLLREATKAKQ